MRRKYKEPAPSHKRLKRNREGSILLEGGGRITKKQQKELENLTRKLNRRRETLIKSFGKDVQNKYNVFGYNSDLLFRQTKLRYNELTTEEKYKKYLTRLKAIDKGTDLKRVSTLYKQNYKEALERVFGPVDGKKLSNLVDHISKDKFTKAILSEELGDIGYIYSPEHLEGKRQIIEAKLKSLTTKRK